MDHCPFVRILVGNLALKFHVPTRSSLSRVQDPYFSCYCKIKFDNFPHQVATIPLIQSGQSLETAPVVACFSLSKPQICLWGSSFKLSIEVYADGNGDSACGLASGKLLGKVSVPLDLHGIWESRPCVLHNGSVPIGRNRSSKNGSCMQLCLNVRTEPDPRFVFQFGGDPECSPQVFQVQGSFKQAVFTCKFGFRSSLSESNRSRNWLSCLKSGRDKFSKELKGWSITIHDLSGSPVAMASMVTPFVPSLGSDRVSRSNPGAWLILRPGYRTWKPWGRLEVWREPGFIDALSYRVNLFHDNIMTATGTTTTTTTTVASSTLSTKFSGKFTMDILTTNMATPIQTPLISSQSSCDFGSSWSHSSSRPGSGSGSDFGKPEVEVGVKHVTCTEDAAAFVALAAAVDLSMDACLPFSYKLRKELRQQTQSFVV
ncbi:hypothetical protein F3Y22_tig00111022pilonHSYRG00727 [Hibiscus syriacus]|uniref:Uncharacterized protein n=1 Tax=Hibiscus syriacus TaxID=106335 RepID=A0A6A2Z6V9_HIBSY|nr:hypothetical protein F3Y22_tig00111022pilonHSYRG00727 [Hibiscus syriacus]